MTTDTTPATRADVEYLRRCITALRADVEDLADAVTRVERDIASKLRELAAAI